MINFFTDKNNIEPNAMSLVNNEFVIDIIKVTNTKQRW